MPQGRLAAASAAQQRLPLLANSVGGLFAGGSLQTAKVIEQDNS